MAAHGRAPIDPFGAASTITGTSRHDALNQADISRQLASSAAGVVQVLPPMRSIRDCLDSPYWPQN
jgi:hypothetical protein